MSRIPSLSQPWDTIAILTILFGAFESGRANTTSTATTLVASTTLTNVSIHVPTPPLVSTTSIPPTDTPTATSAPLVSTMAAVSNKTTVAATCAPGQFRNDSASGAACSGLQVCTSSEYQSTAPTLSTNRVCTVVSNVCDGTQYEFAAPSNTTDRICDDLTVCNDTAQYQSLAPTATTNRECDNLTVCTSGEYMVNASTPTTDRICNQLSTCNFTFQFESAAPTAITNRICSVAAICSFPSQYQESPRTYTTDTVCAHVTTCTLQQFETTSPTITSNRECQPLSLCSYSSEFQIASATTTTDTQCPALAECNQSEYQSVAPTVTSNRNCTNIQRCEPNTYETEAPTATTNRICNSNCIGFSNGGRIVYEQYSTLNATASSSGVCSPLVPCNSNETAVVNGTNYTQWKCLASVGDAAVTTQLPVVDYVGIGLGATVVVLIIVISILYLYNGKRKTQKDLELHEMLLYDERQAREQVVAEVTQMKKAWQILERDLNFVKQLATGGSGTVWHAKWGHNDVAVKILKYAIDGNLNFGDDFDKEVSFMQRIRHPNLLLFYGAGQMSTKCAFLVVELMEEGSMHTLLLSERELDWNTRLNMALDVANGMKHLHAFGCIHRDLKSDNCLVGRDLHVKVGDFGNSKLMEAHNMSQQQAQGVGATHTTDFSSWTLDKFHTQGIGTPLWMAPELLGNTGDVYSAKIDVYSFAMVMWELATRKTPWEGEIKASGIRFMADLRNKVISGARPTFPETILATCPATYVTLVRRCWAPAAADRPEFDESFGILTTLRS